MEYVESLGTVMIPMIGMPLTRSDPLPSPVANQHIAELSSLRGLLAAACLSPFGSLHVLRERISTWVLGIEPHTYVYDRAYFNNLTNTLSSMRVPQGWNTKTAQPAWCTTLMTARLTAAANTLSSGDPPPAYDGSTAPLAGEHSLTRSPHSGELRPLQHNDAATPPMQHTFHALWSSAPHIVLLFILMSLLIQFIINLYAITDAYHGDPQFPHN